MICAMKDCECDAVAAVRLNVPAMNCPIAEHDPLQMVFGIGLCAAHFERAKAEDFLSSMARRIFQITARGRATPDFNRAFIDQLSFDSAEWKTLSKSKKEEPQH